MAHARRPRPDRRRLILLNKPYRVLCQFTDRDGRKTLADFVDQVDVYAAGRLDYESEGLVLLTNDGPLQSWITEPRHALPKLYWVQIEGVPEEDAVRALRQGVELRDGLTAPALVQRMAPPEIWARVPPIRVRKNIPDSWLSLTITEGRNRQVRRMTAAVGHPTLRLIRWAIGPWTLAGLAPGRWRTATAPSSRAELRKMTDDLMAMDE